MVCELHDSLLHDLLKSVRRPGRYFGGEINFPRKRDARLKFLLCFPDLYEIGMSNVGLRILYHVLNGEQDVMADLAFAPWTDMEAFMRVRRMPICGIGSAIPANRFDVVGFSLQHELQYTNVLNMLDLSGIPIRSADRGESDPIVVAGGPCAFNPQPMSDFIEAFALGDGETVSRELATAVMNARTQGTRRSNILGRLSQIEGIYVPAVHTSGAAHLKISRRVEPELKETDFPHPPIVPLIPITHDRLSLEIMRGCTRGCRFCSAGMLTRPVRERRIDSVVRLAEAGIKESGWEEVSLVSLSTSDYYDLEGLVRRLSGVLAQHQVSISLPSMRPGAFSPELARIIGRTRKTGLTFAPEAGSRELRKAINKDIAEDELYQTVETAFRHGWDSLKLYFMLGLPRETDEDIDALVRMVRSVESVCRVYGRRRRITVSLSPFVPRPHTPFQWADQLEPGVLLRRISSIRKGLPDKRIKLKWRDPYMAKLEGLLARGDGSLGAVILKAWKAGSRFDGWTDQFDFGLWMRCFDDSGVDTIRQLEKRDIGEPLPWGFTDGGVSASFLLEEARRAERGELTPDCRTGECTNCGACPGKAATAPEAAHEGKSPVPFVRQDLHVRQVNGRIRYRVRYVKMDDMRLTSHLDVVRCIQRGLRRAQLPVCFSTGFSPHPRVSFGPPLPFGVISKAEYFDIVFLRQPRSGWLDKLNNCLPSGLRALEARLTGSKGPSLMKLIDVATYSVEITFARGALDSSIGDRINEAFSADENVLTVDQSSHGDRIAVDMSVRLTKGSVRPDRILEAVLEGTQAYIKITRTGLYHECDGRLHSPYEVGAGERLDT